jgi:hypothetical protein
MGSTTGIFTRDRSQFSLGPNNIGLDPEEDGKSEHINVVFSAR